MTTTADNQSVSSQLACVYADQLGHRVQLTLDNSPVNARQLTIFASNGATTVSGVGDLSYWNPIQSILSTSTHGVELDLGVFDDHLTMTATQVKAAAITLMKHAITRM